MLRIIGRYLSLFVSAGTLAACVWNSGSPTDAQSSDRQEANHEMAKVIRHYSLAPKDTLKLKAALFLIRGMRGHQTYRDARMELLAKFAADVNKQRRKGYINTSNIEARVVDILRSYPGLDSLAGIAVVSDESYLKSDFVIQGIDDAFYAWTHFPWSKGVSFEDFCEYILPYKVFDEPVSFSWRKDIMREFQWLADSLENPASIREATILVNKSIHSKVVYSPVMKKFPKLLSFENIQRLGVGKCEHLVTYNTYVLRALGIPAMIDYVPAWGNNSAGHTWGAVKDESGKLFAFDALYPAPQSGLSSGSTIPEGVLRKRRAPKIFRVSYQINIPTPVQGIGGVPFSIRNGFKKDVTREYDFPTADVTLKTKGAIADTTIFLSVYNSNQWKPVTFGKRNSDGTYKFEAIGCDAVYLPVVFRDSLAVPVASPFLLNEKGEMTFFEPDLKNLNTITVDRKSSVDYDLMAALGSVVGSVFQGSNNISDGYKNIATISTMPDPRTNVIKVKASGAFRFVRYLNSENVCRIAELRFYGTRISASTTRGVELLEGRAFSGPSTSTGKMENAFDGDVLTYYTAQSRAQGFVGLDFGKGNEASLTEIHYYPPNDGNSVEIGNAYELCYWDNQWKSLGQIVAFRERLAFRECPKNALFRLRNLTKGYKERIFTIEDGKQVWW